MPELDLRTSKNPQVTHYFALRKGNQRAMQCPAPGRDGKFYVSQAEGSRAPENICVTENDATTPNHKRLRQMRLVKAGHGSTIAAMYINDELWILANAWKKLRLIKFREGDVRYSATDKTIRDFNPAGYSHGHIDPDAGTICLRRGNAFWLYELNGDGTLGKKLGAADKDLTSTGPAQGFFSMRWDNRWYLFTCWDFGRPESKPTVVVGSLDTGKKLYSINIRASFPTWAKRREPESGFGLTIDTEWGRIPVAHIGASVTRGSAKLGVAVAMPVPLPVVVVPVPLPVVTMYVRPVGDPVWVREPFEVWARDGKGVMTKIVRKPDYQVIGSVVDLKLAGTKIIAQYVRNERGEHYKLTYLTDVAPA